MAVLKRQKADGSYEYVQTVGLDVLKMKDDISESKRYLLDATYNTYEDKNYGDLQERLDEEHNVLKSQLAQRPSYDEARLKTVKIELEDMSENTLGAMSGNATFNLLSVPQEESVGVSKLDSKVLNDLYSKKNTTLDWEIGSITSTTGNDSNSFTNRVRSVGFTEFDNAILKPIDTTTKYIVFTYSKTDSSFLSQTGWLKGAYRLPSNVFVRIVLAYDNDSTLTDTTISTKIEFLESKFKTVEKSNSVTQVTSGDEWEWFGSVISESDITVVKGELWTFYPSNDEHTDYQIARRYSLNFDTKSTSLLGSFNHNFGHVNTVDYCEENDTLIMGNGSGAYGTIGEIYLIKNPYAFAGNTQVNLDDVALKINCAGYGFGDKFNVLWGESNNAKYNICYLITNDQEDIRKLLLGMGTNNLGMGQFVSGKGSSEFNGTFKVLSHYQQVTEGYDDVLQGGDYYNGILYTGAGHDGIRYWVQRLLTDGKVERTDKLERIYGDDGNEIFTTMNGLTVYNNHLLVKSNKGLRVIKI